MPRKIIIIGAGMVGSLWAIYMARRGYDVNVFEKRPDPRLHGMQEGRSINLALSHRGLRALQAIGLDKKLQDVMIPMYGRMLHDTDGSRRFLPYSTKAGEYINSISRLRLNIELIQAASQYTNIRFHFEAACEAIDLEQPAIGVSLKGKKQWFEADTLFGADGAGSLLRKAMQAKTLTQERVDWLDYAYKELSLPPNAQGNFSIEKNALHIWARKTFMLIALPNPDATFTCTLFLPLAGSHASFEALRSEKDILAFFDAYFPDVIPHMPRLTEEFLTNPTGSLATVYTYPWAYKDKALLIGDAAHAIVPFYGQGMNAAFEDCVLLDTYLEQYRHDWSAAFCAYQQARKPDTDAIAALALDNFREMRDDVNDALFQRVRQLEYRLEQHFDDYWSKYAMVTFHPEIPYSLARQRGNAQNKILFDICRHYDSLDQIDLNMVYERLKQAAH